MKRLAVRLDPVQDFAHEVERVKPFSSDLKPSPHPQRGHKRSHHEPKSVLKQPKLLKQIHKFRLLERKRGKLLQKILGFGEGCSNGHSCCKIGLLHSCCKGAQFDCCRNHQSHMMFPDDGLEAVDSETFGQQNSNPKRKRPASEIRPSFDQDTDRRKLAPLDQIVFIGKLNALPNLQEPVTPPQPQSHQQSYQLSQYSSIPSVHTITGFLSTDNKNFVGRAPGFEESSSRPLHEDIAYLRTVAERLRPLLASSPKDSSAFSVSNGFANVNSPASSEHSSSLLFKSPSNASPQRLDSHKLEQRLAQIIQDDHNPTADHSLGTSSHQINLTS